MAENGAGIYYLTDAEGYGFTEAALPSPEAESPLVWMRLVPQGQFEHPDPVIGKFNVAAADIQAMETNFRAGIPTTRGIPIDEDGLHQLRGEGAFGWVREVAVRDGDLWGGIEWTPDGIEAISSGRLPFISPHFFTKGGTATFYRKNNIVIAAALCSRPFFFDQPQLKIAASAYVRVGDAGAEPPEEAIMPDESTVEVTETEAKAETRDEELAAPEQPVAEDKGEQGAEGAEAGAVEQEATQEVTQEGAEPPPAEAATGAANEGDAEPEATREELLAQIQQLTAERDTLRERVEGMEARLAQLERSDAVAAAEQQIAASMEVPDGFRLSPVALGIMAAAQVDPSPENQQALLNHLQQNGGKLALVPLGGKPALSAIGASGEITDEMWLAAYPITDETKARVRAISAKQGIGLRPAYEVYKQELNRG